MRPSTSSPQPARGLSQSNGRRDKVGKKKVEKVAVFSYRSFVIGSSGMNAIQISSLCCGKHIPKSFFTMSLAPKAEYRMDYAFQLSALSFEPERIVPRNPLYSFSLCPLPIPSAHTLCFDPTHFLFPTSAFRLPTSNNPQPATPHSFQRSTSTRPSRAA